MNILVYLFVLVVVYMLWGLTIRLGLNKLSCTRAFSKPAVFAGETGELVEVVRNDRPFIIPWLRVESQISPHIRLGRQDNLRVSGDMYYCSLFTLMPYQQIRRRHKVLFLHRGAYDLGNASLTAGDVLGFYRSQRTQSLHVPVLVYPQLLSDDEVEAPMSRVMGELVRRRQLLQDPFLVRGIRPYTPGDPVRDIHWPATARTGEVQVRVRDYTARTRLLVVLNMQNDDLQWKDNLPAHDIDAVEYGISMAATLCVRALRDGLAAGLAANMPMKDKPSESTLLLPADDAAREEEILAAFARLTVTRSQNFPAFLESLTAYSGLDILILSRYDSESIQAQMQQLRRSGNQVSLQLYKEVG